MSNFDHFIGTRAVPGAQAVDLQALSAYLSQHLDGFKGPLTAEIFKGGQSNPTYKLITPDASYVMRAKPGPVARLLPTTAATTLRKDREPPLVIDGPFAETKEQLLGFFVIDCADLAEALEITKELGVANPGGSYEIRPIAAFWPAPPAA